LVRTRRRSCDKTYPDLRHAAMPRGNVIFATACNTARPVVRLLGVERRVLPQYRDMRMALSDAEVNATWRIPLTKVSSPVATGRLVSTRRSGPAHVYSKPVSTPASIHACGARDREPNTIGSFIMTPSLKRTVECVAPMSLVVSASQTCPSRLRHHATPRLVPNGQLHIEPLRRRLTELLQFHLRYFCIRAGPKGSLPPAEAMLSAVRCAARTRIQGSRGRKEALLAPIS